MILTDLVDHNLEDINKFNFTIFFNEIMNKWKTYNYVNCGLKNYLKEDHRSYIHNLCSCEKKAWKKFRLVRDSNPWPLRYRCSSLPILRSQANWEQVAELVRYKPVKGWWWNYEYMKNIYVSCEVKNYLKDDHHSFRLSFRNCISCVYNCNDLPSNNLSFIIEMENPGKWNSLLMGV